MESRKMRSIFSFLQWGREGIGLGKLFNNHGVLVLVNQINCTKKMFPD